MVASVYIQDKYYNSSSASVKACFDEKGLFKYLTSDGLPMQIEVPKDQYSEAVSIMEERIRTGKVPEVTDPNEAKNIIRKGNLTYAQTKNLGKENETMAKYKIIFEGIEEDEVFDTYEEADEYALYMVSCYHTGAEIFEMSNPGDYPYDPDYEPDYEIIEV